MDKKGRDCEGKCWERKEKDVDKYESGGLGKVDEVEGKKNRMKNTEEEERGRQSSGTKGRRIGDENYNEDDEVTYRRHWRKRRRRKGYEGEE